MVIRPIELKIEAEVKKMIMRRQIDKKDDPSLSSMQTFLPIQPLLLSLISVNRLHTSMALDVESDTNSGTFCSPTAKTSDVTMGYTYAQSTAQAPHRRAQSEPVNHYNRHKTLPLLPHEIETNRSRSLPEQPSGTSRRNHRPLSKYAVEMPPHKNRALPSPPLQTSQADLEKWSAAVETAGMTKSWSFFPYWSKILLLKCESVESWEEKLTFAREMQDCWTERKLFAHEVQDCAYHCACGMV